MRNNIKLVYSNSDFIVISKPQGISCQGDLTGGLPLLIREAINQD